MAVNWPQCARVPSRSCSLTHAELIKWSPKLRRPLRFFRDTKTLIKILRSLPGRSNNKNSLLKLQTKEKARKLTKLLISLFDILISLLALPAYYAKQGLCNCRVSVRLSVRPSVYLSVCLSVCLSICPTPANPLVQVCCCGPSWESDIDRLLLGARQRGIRQGENAGSATSSACVGSWTQTCNTDCVPGGE